MQVIATAMRHTEAGREGPLAEEAQGACPVSAAVHSNVAIIVKATLIPRERGHPWRGEMGSMRALVRWIGTELATWLIAGAVLVVLLSLAMPWPAATAVGGGITVAIAIASWVRRSRQRMARHRTLDSIDDMTGEEFEDWLAVLFRRAGWHVRHTATTGDFGADLVISRDGEDMVVQAKRQARPVGVAAVQQAAAARPHYDTDGAMVVTNAGFTAQAITLAGSADVELWDRDDIARELIDPRRGTPRNP